MKIFRRYPAFLPVLTLLAGILAGVVGAPLWVITCPLVVAFGFWIWRNTHRNPPSHAWPMRWIPMAVAGCICFAIGIAADIVHQPEQIDFENDKLPMMVVGEVEEVTSKTYGDRMKVRLEAMADTTGQIQRGIRHHRAIITATDCSFLPHDRIMFVNGLTKITDNPNYQTDGIARNFELQGIMWRQTVKADHVRRLEPCHSFMAHCEDIRTSLEIRIERSRLSHQTKAFLITMLLGDSYMLTPDLREIFADAGISHVLAVSGLHTGIIATIILILTSPMVLCGWRRGRYATVILLTWVYVLLTGCHISALRAAIMVSLVMGALIIERRHSSFNALCVALFVILLFSPRAILTPALQLSFVSVGSLLCFGDYAGNLSRCLPRGMQKLCSVALVSMVAVFGSWAITAYYFHTLPLLFLPVNMMVLPLLPLYLILAIGYLILAGAGAEIGWLAQFLDISFNCLLRGCEAIAGNAVVDLWEHPLTPLLWIGALCFCAYALHRRSRAAGVSSAWLMICSVLTIFLLPNDRPRDGVIVRDTPGTVAFTTYSEGQSEQPEYRVGESKALLLPGAKICITGHETAPQQHFADSCDYLIVSCGNRSLRDLQGMFRARHILLHPSLNSRRRETLLREAYESGTKITDLSVTGPLHIFDSTQK